MTAREDTGSRTEADAAAFERRFAPEPYDDGPSASDFSRDLPAHTCWRNGGVECRRCDIEERAAEGSLADSGSTPVAVVLAVCIFGVLLFLALISQGQRAMCATHHDQLRYCAHYQETTSR